MENVFYNLPLLVVLLLTTAIIATAFEGGFLLGRRQAKGSPREKDSLVGPMVAATLGLLAFMLAFTFNVAADHFNTRRRLVLEEANAKRSAYAMAAMLADEPCIESRKLLREYIDIRLDDIQTRQEVQRMIARSDQIQDQLWSIAMTSAQNTGAGSPYLYIQALSETINMQANRISYGMHGKVSASIWIVLYWLAAMGMAAMGYHAGLVGVRGFFAYIVLVLTFSFVLTLIYDLDRPKQRLFKVSQQTMMDLQQRLAKPNAD
ncbi:MAG: hypothetical protein LLF76_14650 [Planctomycetaceae bacterium]|nr:hypothetical protein [Planctomycetaceae bacterium]